MSKPSDNIEAIFHYIAETGDLMRMPRSQDRFLGNSFDTVASHAHHTAIIAYCLARMEGLTHDQGLQALAMGVLHDNAEVRTGDLNLVEKYYADADEEKARYDQLKDLPFANELHDIVNTYEKREALEAKCAKDADALEQMYQQWVLAYLGNQMAKRWLEGNKEHRIPHLRTESAKMLALLFYKETPDEWWYKDMDGKKMDLTKLNGKR